MEPEIEIGQIHAGREELFEGFWRCAIRRGDRGFVRCTVKPRRLLDDGWFRQQLHGVE